VNVLLTEIRRNRLLWLLAFVPVLVVGHYCHDTIVRNAGVHRTLGGSAAYVSAILDAAVEQNDTGNMGPVLTVALALRSVDESHADCLGGEQGCGCQHRGTTAERRPATTP